MIFLIPIPVIAGSAIAYVLGKHAFVECYNIGTGWTSNTPNILVRDFC